MSSVIAANVVGGAVGIYSATQGSSGGGGGRRQQRLDREQQQAQYDQTREDYMPYAEAGYGAVNQLQNPHENFMASPGYEFRRDEGIRDVGNFFSARTSGGNAMKALAEFNQGLATDEFGNWWKQQQGLANMGQNAVAGTASAGQNNANMQSNSYQNQSYQEQQNQLQRYSGINNSVQGSIENWQYGRNRRGLPSTHGPGTSPTVPDASGGNPRPWGRNRNGW